MAAMVHPCKRGALAAAKQVWGSCMMGLNCCHSVILCALFLVSGMVWSRHSLHWEPSKDVRAAF